MIKCALQSGGTLQIEYNCYFLRRPENWSIRRKTSTRSKDENNNKLNPHMTPSPGIELRPQLVGDECSHYCPIPASPANGREGLEIHFQAQNFPQILIYELPNPIPMECVKSHFPCEKRENPQFCPFSTPLLQVIPSTLHIKQFWRFCAPKMKHSGNDFSSIKLLMELRFIPASPFLDQT